QENGYLSKVDFVKLETENVKNRTFSYYSNLHSSILSVSREHIAHNKNLIIFAESKSHAISLSILLKSNGLLNELIVGETPAELRQIYLERFADNNDNLNILVNHQILSTGIDVPGLNSIAVLANIESP